MKKLMIFIVLLIVANAAKGQNGALTINCSISGCTIYANMIAKDPTSGNSSFCDIVSCTIVVPYGTSAVFSDPGAVDASLGGPGYCSLASTPLPSYWASFSGTTPPTHFVWTDIAYQLTCDGVIVCSGRQKEPAFLVQLVQYQHQAV